LGLIKNFLEQEIKPLNKSTNSNKLSNNIKKLILVSSCHCVKGNIPHLVKVALSIPPASGELAEIPFSFISFSASQSA
jgi:hypothetical protein